MEHRKGYVRLINDQMAPSPLTASMASSVFRRLSKRADMVKDGSNLFMRNAHKPRKPEVDL